GYRHPTGPARRCSREGRPRRVGGLFPPPLVRSSSTRSGPSWARSRRTATRPTPPTITAGITGITSPTTPSTGWSLWSSPRRRPVVAATPGAGPEESGAAIGEEVAGRLGGSPPELMTSDENPVYETAIRDTFGEPVPAERKPGRPRVVPQRRVPEGVVYATVH